MKSCRARRDGSTAPVLLPLFFRARGSRCGARASARGTGTNACSEAAARLRWRTNRPAARSIRPGRRLGGPIPGGVACFLRAWSDGSSNHRRNPLIRRPFFLLFFFFCLNGSLGRNRSHGAPHPRMMKQRGTNTFCWPIRTDGTAFLDWGAYSVRRRCRAPIEGTGIAMGAYIRPCGARSAAEIVTPVAGRGDGRGGPRHRPKGAMEDVAAPNLPRRGRAGCDGRPARSHGAMVGEDDRRTGRGPAARRGWRAMTPRPDDRVTLRVSHGQSQRYGDAQLDHALIGYKTYRMFDMYEVGQEGRPRFLLRALKGRR